ncbi:CAP domain-containing protein [Paraburkholderia phymatum]|uniref:CAP domain-containing protein n=1 Tax=Paraburkholderia phymatum TaxID=148447 RepID=A0ACC6U879_9BURK
MKKISVLTAVSFAAALALSACGGGGGGGGSSATSSAAPATGASAPGTANLTTPQYTADSAQSAAFTLLNQQRQQCGLPAMQENPALDQAAQAHAQYMATNNVVSDTETSGNPGFVGTTYSDRNTHFGYSQNVYSGGVSGGFYTNAKLTETQYGQQLVYGWLSGVYHIAIGAWPLTAVGIGDVETTFNGFPQVWASMSIGTLQSISQSAPLTFPCQGTTGVAYKGAGETPTPPNTSGAWGTPIAVVGNQQDKIVIQSGTMTDTSGTVITLQVLDSSTDPNKLLPAFEGVAYPATPLSPNASYSVTLTGTINGTPFSRTFTFTTGNVVG